MKVKRLVTVLLILALISIAIVGCAPKETADEGDETESTAAPVETGEETEAPETSYKVAMVLSGVINDAGWNESAYNGLMMAETDFGVETAYTESVAQPDFESVMRDYAAQGYDLLIAVGGEFSDASLVVAPDFPDTLFAVMNGNDFQEPNLAAYRFNTPETGFIAGVAAALYSETNIVGMVGGTTLPHIIDAVDAYEVGAKYITPDIEVIIGYSESMTDVAKGKEMGMAFVEQGADVLSANANACALGVIEAAVDKGIRHIGYVSDGGADKKLDRF